jgi:hypothetical protein
MAATDATMTKMNAELRQFGNQWLELLTRAEKLRDKWNSNSLGSAAMPPGEELTADQLRGAFYHLVTDFIAYARNGSPGQADRITTHWILNRDQGV